MSLTININPNPSALERYMSRGVGQLFGGADGDIVGGSEVSKLSAAMKIAGYSYNEIENIIKSGKLSSSNIRRILNGIKNSSSSAANWFRAEYETAKKKQHADINDPVAPKKVKQTSYVPPEIKQKDIDALSRNYEVLWRSVNRDTARYELLITKIAPYIDDSTGLAKITIKNYIAAKNMFDYAITAKAKLDAE